MPSDLFIVQRLFGLGDHITLSHMPRSANSHLFTFILLTLFASVFATFLVFAAYKYVTDGENMELKSFAPGVPAFFLGFLARNEFRGMRAARKTERVRAARAAREREGQE